jgi:phosphatidylethanolamine-binding protein (PEBP) family uncharacterized protein
MVLLSLRTSCRSSFLNLNLSLLLLLLSLSTVLSALPPSAASLRQEQLDLRAHKVYGDVVDVFLPTTTLDLEYGKTKVAMGDQVLPSIAEDAPLLNVQGLTEGKKYTIVMTDPGVLADMDIMSLESEGDGNSPPRYLRKLAPQVDMDQDSWQWLHWIVQDVEVVADESTDNDLVLDLTNAYTVTEYSGPNPPEGNHRYVVLLMEQQEFNGYRANQGTEVITERGAFSTREYINSHQVDVVGAMVYYSEN